MLNNFEMIEANLKRKVEYFKRKGIKLKKLRLIYKFLLIIVKITIK